MNKNETARTLRNVLRLVRATQSIPRVELARALGVNRSTITETVKPLIRRGILIEKAVEDSRNRMQGRPPVSLTFQNEKDYFVGVNLGARRSQIGLTTLSGEMLGETEFETPADAQKTLQLAREGIENLCQKVSERKLRGIGVSVAGPTDAARRKIVYAPNLDWRGVSVADALENVRVAPDKTEKVSVVVENDATAAALYEARSKMRETRSNDFNNFVLIRSGTGIGVGLVIDGEIYRGGGRSKGIAGEFGHMTIMAGGKPCVCGNRGCWERYASAAAAASLYTGDRAVSANQNLRFLDIVGRAETGEIRAARTLEKIGEYLGIGIANVIMGVGVSQVIISGRLVFGWKFIEQPMREAVGRSIVGSVPDWAIERGEAQGSALGGALEVAVEEFISNGLKI